MVGPSGRLPTGVAGRRLRWRGIASGRRGIRPARGPARGSGRRPRRGRRTAVRWRGSGRSSRLRGRAGCRRCRRPRRDRGTSGSDRRAPTAGPVTVPRCRIDWCGAGRRRSMWWKTMPAGVTRGRHQRRSGAAGKQRQQVRLAGQAGEGRDRPQSGARTQPRQQVGSQLRRGDASIGRRGWLQAQAVPQVALGGGRVGVVHGGIATPTIPRRQQARQGGGSVGAKWSAVRRKGEARAGGRGTRSPAQGCGGAGRSTVLSGPDRVGFRRMGFTRRLAWVKSAPPPHRTSPHRPMKVLSSLSSMKRRHADCQVVRRKGTLYVICKSNPKFKSRQGMTKGTRLSKKGVK